jgi:hypothetical protein
VTGAAISGRGPGPGSGSGSGAPSPSRSRASWIRDATVVVRAVLRHPSLWWASVGALRRMARRGWWRRAPFLPLPGEAYWQFRLVTAYGTDGETAVLTASDIVAYLRWCQRSRPRRG